MTAEQLIIACAVQLARDNHGYLECLFEFDDDPLPCSEWNHARELAIERLDQALKTAGIDVRDPAVWDKWRKGQGFDV
jgi:hypothetical protein